VGQDLDICSKKEQGVAMKGPIDGIRRWLEGMAPQPVTVPVRVRR